MRVRFVDDDLERLEAEPSFTAGFAPEVVKAYRKRIQAIRSADDERPLRALVSNHFEKLKGDLAGKYSVRLNDKWRLVFELEGDGANKTVIIFEIIDYH